MLKCPFCGYDYSEHGLRDGRCPGCGGVLAWEGGSGDVSDSVRAAVLAQTINSFRPGARPAPLVPVAPPANPLVPPPHETGPAPSASSSSAPSSAPNPAEPTAEPTGPSPGHDSEAVPARLIDRPPELPSEILRTIAPALLTPEDMRDVSAAWKAAAESEGTRPESTLKGRSGGKVTDTQLVIQTRSIVNKQDNPSIPVGAEYELLNVIGKGGVGVVYLARQSSIDRDVAVKMLRTDRTEDPTNRDKFLAEAVVTGDLEHPNIVPIYDLGSDASGALFYSMKRVQGTPWNEVLHRQPLARNLEILLKVSDAIAFAHARGIIHRDIKPENVMLGEFGEVLVMDWGIALPLESYGKSSGFLRTQGLGGSPAYMSPEMVTGPPARIGPTSDIYLLGAALYEILTGRPPHAGRSVMDCLMAAARNDIVVTDVSGELMEIALRALATRSEDRYPTVQAFQAAIRDYQSHAESIALSTRAATDLDQARRTASYDDYSRAVFAHQEALALWHGNRTARGGVNEAKLAYAACAFEKGDYDLGLSLLDPENPTHAELREQLTAAVAERNARQSRLRYVKRLVAALVVLLFVGGAAALWSISAALKNARISATKAQLAANEARAAEGVAKDEKLRAEAAQEDEKRARDKAVLSERETLVQKKIAEDRGLAAEDARQQVEEASYFAEIDVVAAKIKSNSFDVARQILRSQEAGDAPDASGSRKARYRHWEWGRLRFLCREEEPLGQAAPAAAPRHAAVHAFRAPWPVEAFTLAPDDQTVALGGRGGEIELRTADNELLATAFHPGGVASLAFSADGRFLASGGASGGTVLVWERADRKELRPLHGAAPIRHVGQVRGVVFAPGEPLALLTVADKVVRRWDWQAEQNPPTWKEGIAYRGHLDRVWSAAFSSDGRWILSGSEDATVRLWNRATGREIARFSGHEGPVYAVAFAPDDRWFASAGYDKRVLLWNLAGIDFTSVAATGRSEKSIVQEIRNYLKGEVPRPAYFALEGHSASIRTVAFSPRNNVLVTAGQDNTAIVWNTEEALRGAESVWEHPAGAATQKPARAAGPAAPSDANAATFPVANIVAEPLQKVLRSHGTWIEGCAVTRDGAGVFTNSNDGTWRRWDVAAYEEIRVLHDPDHHAVTAARFVPGGKQIVTAHSDGNARLWDIETGRELGRFGEGHDFLMTTAKFFPDGRRLLTTAGDGTARVWNLSTRVELLCLHGTGRRAIAAISPDGARILTAGAGGTARWWNADQGQLLRTLPPPTHAANSSGGDDADATLVSFQRRAADVTAVAVDSTSRRLLTGDAEGRCWLWNADDGRASELATGHSKSVSAVYFLPDLPWTRQRGLLAVTAADDGQVRVWNRELQSRADGRLDVAAPIDASCLSADGRQFVCAASTGDATTGLWWWDVSEARVLARQELVGESVNSMEFARSGEGQVLVTTTDLKSSQQDVKVWTLAAADAPPRTYAMASSGRRTWEGAVWHATESPDGKHLITAGGKSARLWNLDDGRLAVNLRSHTSILALDVSPDGKWLVTAGSEGAVKLWDVTTRQPVQRLDGAHPQGQAVTCAEFSPDGRWVLTAGQDAVYLWDRERGTPVSVGEGADRALVRVSGGSLNVARFAPDGRHLLTAAQGTPPTLWKLVAAAGDGLWRAEKLRSLEAAGMSGEGASSVKSAAFSLDGRWIITGGDDRLARLWSRAEGRQLATLSGHSASIVSVAFSADGFRALTGSDDNRAMLWDTRTLSRLNEQNRPGENGARSSGTSVRAPEEIFTLSRYRGATLNPDQANSTDETHGRRVTTVAFSPSGRYVLTASEDGSAFVWPGMQLAPAIDLSLGKKTIVAGRAGQWIDDKALVARSAAELLEPAALDVSVASAAGSSDKDLRDCRLSLAPIGDEIGHWEVREEAIVYQSPFESSPREIGSVHGGANGEPLEVRLQTGTPGHVLEAIVRSVALASPAAEDDAVEAVDRSRTVTVSFRLRSGSTTDASHAQTESRVVEIGPGE